MLIRNTIVLAGFMLSAQASQAAEIVVSSNVTKDDKWTKDNVYILEDSIFVKNGATLTIEAGTWVVGRKKQGENTRGSLVITRNGRIDAVGTKSEPIVFTAKEEYDGQKLDPAAGDGGLWGGVIILGNAPVNNYNSPTTNSNEGEIEGFPAGSTDDIRFGGKDARSNSGRMKYVSIRFGGYEFAPNEEINALTLGGVGSDTEIECIELVSNTDDGFEIFGGTVNTKRIAVAFAQDDSFDLDSGHQGKHQFWFCLQNANPALGNRGGEWDGGNGEVKDQPPFTTPDIYNVTFIGNGVDNGAAADSNQGIFIDDNFAGKIRNSLFHDFSGVMVEDSGDGKGIVLPDPSFENCTFGDFGSGKGDLDDFAGNGVDTIKNPGIGGVSREPNGLLDPRPTSGSPLLSASLSKLPRQFFEAAPYRGAFAPDENWLDGWSYLSREGYLPAPADQDAPVFEKQPKDIVASKNGKVTLMSKASADGAVSYHWFKDGKRLKGKNAKRKNYKINKLKKKNTGTYYCVATSDGESTESDRVDVEIAKLKGRKRNATGKVGKMFRLKLKTNFKADQYKSKKLPRGLKINNRGVIKGRPRKQGNFWFTIVAQQGKGKNKIEAKTKQRIRIR